VKAKKTLSVASSPRFGGLACMRLVLTKSTCGTNFPLFRGHLSRPACSHVKQLAKQAGDSKILIPAEPMFRPVFYGL
jgi:hypothetical protein